MATNTLKDSLISSGFDPSMADIYLALAEAGETTVGKLVEKTSLSRAGAYDALNYLLGQGFVEYRKEGRNAYYKLTHPEKLRDLLAERKREVKTLEDELANTIKTVTGMYNLSQNKPGVRFFEGAEGVKEALYHSLEAKDTILAFVDSKSVDQYAKEMDEEYVKARIAKKIQKKIIMTRTPESEKYAATMDTTWTEVRLIDADKYPFSIAMEIYNDTLSYIALSNTYTAAYLITHEAVARFHTSIFHFVWEHLKPVVRLAIPPSQIRTNDSFPKNQVKDIS